MISRHVLDYIDARKKALLNNPGTLEEAVLDLAEEGIGLRAEIASVTAKYEEEIEELKYRLEKVRGSREEAEYDLEDARSEIKTLKYKNARLTEDLDDSKSDVRSGQQLIDALKEDPHNAHFDGDNAVEFLEGELEAARAEIKALKAELAAYGLQNHPG